jgi:DNA-binding transcriptional regulator GbsR (MarR family)
VRDGNLKLVVKKNGNRKELYNLEKDISESNNIASSNKNDVQRLYNILNEWESELIDPIFLGLIHTKSWRNRTKKKSQKK